MSDLARILRKPIEVTLQADDGPLVLKLSRLNDMIRLECEDWVEERVKKSYEKAMTFTPDLAKRAELSAALQKAMLEDRYAFGKPGFLEQLNSFDGVTFLLVRLLEANHPGVTADEVIGLFSEHGAAIREGLDRVMRDEGKKKPTASERSSSPLPATS